MTPKKNKIVITGGSGFIGTNLTNYYRDNSYEVFNIDRKEPKDSNTLQNWRKCDITDFDALNKVIHDIQPDYIVHLAARTDLDGKSIDEYSANTIGTENVLKAAASLKSLKKIIITSSMLVCHTGYVPKDQHDYSPTTFYGESKVITEKLTWQNKPACDWAIIRPTSIWGPWFGVPYRNFFDTVKAGMYFHIGHRSCSKTYGYVENAVWQIDQILRTPTPQEDNKVFYIGDEPAINIEEWANEIAGEVGQKILRIPYPFMRLAALFGDVLGKVGIPFPMTSFRLKNMTTNNIVPLSNTTALAKTTPVDRITAVKRTLEWMKKEQ